MMTNWNLEATASMTDTWWDLTGVWVEQLEQDIFLALDHAELVNTHDKDIKLLRKGSNPGNPQGQSRMNAT